MRPINPNSPGCPIDSQPNQLRPPAAHPSYASLAKKKTLYAAAAQSPAQFKPRQAVKTPSSQAANVCAGPLRALQQGQLSQLNTRHHNKLPTRNGPTHWASRVSGLRAEIGPAQPGLTGTFPLRSAAINSCASDPRNDAKSNARESEFATIKAEMGQLVSAEAQMHFRSLVQNAWLISPGEARDRLLRLSPELTRESARCVLSFLEEATQNDKIREQSYMHYCNAMMEIQPTLRTSKQAMVVAVSRIWNERKPVDSVLAEFDITHADDRDTLLIISEAVKIDQTKRIMRVNARP